LLFLSPRTIYDPEQKGKKRRGRSAGRQAGKTKEGATTFGADAGLRVLPADEALQEKDHVYFSIVPELLL